jgi:hypothetical protein
MGSNVHIGSDRYVVTTVLRLHVVRNQQLASSLQLFPAVPSCSHNCGNETSYRRVGCGSEINGASAGERGAATGNAR